jgi:hypothetical protein
MSINFNYYGGFHEQAEVIAREQIGHYSLYSCNETFFNIELKKILDKKTPINIYENINKFDTVNDEDEEQEDDFVYESISYVYVYNDYVILFDIDKTIKNSKILNLTIYYNQTDSNIKLLIKELYAYKLNNNSTHFYTIGVGRHGYILERNDIPSIDINLHVNYGSDFKQHDKAIKHHLTKQSGLLLFYGPPGCGKTMYIRHLISEYSNLKKVIFLPSYMIQQLSKPELISFIKRYKNTLLILEDAEFALLNRSNVASDTQAVSNLLNITDGLLNDITKIQVLATFNIEQDQIDPALLREGRLLYKYKFDKLSIEDSKKVADNLSIDIDINDEMTLAEIYNYEDYIKNIQNKGNRKIGFTR